MYVAVSRVRKITDIIIEDFEVSRFILTDAIQKALIKIQKEGLKIDEVRITNTLKIWF